MFENKLFTESETLRFTQKQDKYHPINNRNNPVNTSRERLQGILIFTNPIQTF